MVNRRRLRRPTLNEVLAAAWVALIYATIPLVRTLREWFVARWDQSVIGYGVIAVVLAATAAAMLRSIRKERRPLLATAPWLAAVAAVLVWWTARLWKQPEEAVHFLEYGVLGWLLVRALRPRIPDGTVYLTAGLLGTLVGTVDEIIQWITPGRYWDFRDIVLNGGACGLALIALWRLQPAGPAVSVGSLRLPCRLAAGQLALLTLCLANTPQRVAWYADRLPLVGVLRHPTNDMVEYGHRYVVEGIGEFRSRLTLPELQRTDAERWRDAAASVDRYPAARYGRFLEEWPASRDPFVHEARVHIFSRDRNLTERRRQRPGSTAFRRHATVALREHQILELAFPNTLRASSFQLPPAAVAALQRQHLPGFYVVSKVGSHLVTWTTEGQLRITLLIAVVSLLAADRYLGRTTTYSKGPERWPKGRPP